MKSSPVVNSFNSGELSPTLDGRSDLAKYQSSCKLLENFLPLVQGPITRRAGFRYVAATRDMTKRAWLIRFEFSASQAWILEFGDLYVRFFASHGRVLAPAASGWTTITPYVVGDLVAQSGSIWYCAIAHTSGVFASDAVLGRWHQMTDGAFSIPSPYAAADLVNDDGTCALKFVQSGDVLYIAHQARTYEPQKLTRLATTDWRFTPYQPKAGPLLSQNITSATIYSDASTGNVTLTASDPIFAATDVGRLVRVDVQNQVVKPWETNKAYTLNDLTRYDGKTYKALNSDTSGTSPPIHEKGTAFDGKSGVEWEYQDSGYGVVRITAYTSANAVDGDVLTDEASGLKQLPADVVGSGNATARWQLGAWSGTTEYPASVTFWRNRLWWGGRLGLWASVPNDFESMAGDFFGLTTLDNAIWASVQAEDVNDILWISGTTKIIIGTQGGEFVGSEITTTDALGPGNFKIERHSKRRSRAVQPLAIGDILAYVQRAGRRLLSMFFRVEREVFVSSDLAVLAERLTRAGIVDHAYQAEPYSIIWCALQSGGLVGFTYDQDQEVQGWSRHRLGGSGIVESVATIPSPDGLGEELWAITRRTIDGNEVRYVEFLERSWEGPDNDGSGGDDQEDAFYVDCGLTYDGVPADDISGLDHLEGEEVQILADGATHPNRTVAAGAITLDREASVVHVGLACPARMVSHDLESGGPAGTSQGKPSRIYKVAVRFIDTLGGKIGMPNPSGLSLPSTLDEIDFRVPADPMDSAPPIFAGIKDMVFPGDWNNEKRVEILADQPLPMTVASIMPRLHTNDR
jgi:hypothetical protein